MSAIFGLTFHIGRMTEVLTPDIYRAHWYCGVSDMLEEVSIFSSYNLYSVDTTRIFNTPIIKIHGVSTKYKLYFFAMQTHAKNLTYFNTWPM